MLMEKEREQLIEYGKKLVDTDLTKGTGGNLSIYDRQNGHVAITPSGIDFYKIQKADITILNLNGEVIEGETVPSSEWQMHLKEYQKRDDIDAIIHAHTVYATVLSVLHEPLPASHYMIAVAGKDVRVAQYATYGSKELAETSFEAMKDRKAVFLANHGLLAGSYNLANTFNIIEEIEYCSKIYCIAKSIGNPVILPDEEMSLMAKKFENYGQVK
ncbi:L-fuculose-phosphate aldolase [Companilactobacillus zhachilii]|uniref:L-fuculose-phosphate aldolase n=1 Tax=Companilactobacillus zhachilii TaxID=2304606 RepID=UPI00403398B3